MSYVPPSCFDYVFMGSGSNVYYGGSTMGTCSPLGKDRTKHRSGDIIVMPPSGSLFWYYAHLDSRYDTPPSGWNA